MNTDLRDQIVARMDALMVEYEKLEAVLKVLDGAPMQMSRHATPPLNGQAVMDALPRPQTHVEFIVDTLRRNPQGLTPNEIVDHAPDEKTKTRLKKSGVIHTTLGRLVKNGTIRARGSHGAKLYFAS